MAVLWCLESCVSAAGARCWVPGPQLHVRTVRVLSTRGSTSDLSRSLRA